MPFNKAQVPEQTLVSLQEHRDRRRTSIAPIYNTPTLAIQRRCNHTIASLVTSLMTGPCNRPPLTTFLAAHLAAEAPVLPQRSQYRLGSLFSQSCVTAHDFTGNTTSDCPFPARYFTPGCIMKERRNIEKAVGKKKLTTLSSVSITL